MSYVITKGKCIGFGMCAKASPADALSKTDYIAPGKKKPALRPVTAEKAALFRAAISHLF